jgi:hypothetical protein
VCVDGPRALVDTRLVRVQSTREHESESGSVDAGRRTVASSVGAAQPVRGGGRFDRAAILSLQRSVGNAAVNRLLQRCGPRGCSCGGVCGERRGPQDPSELLDDEFPRPGTGAALLQLRRAAADRAMPAPRLLQRLPPDPAPAPPVSPPQPRPPERVPAPPPTPAPSPAPAPACATPYAKASSFQELIGLVQAAEGKLAANGITDPKAQIHALRGVFYGTTWSMDYLKAGGTGEKSVTRNEGFQRFTRAGEDPAKSAPIDVRPMLDCNLYEALRDSPEVTDPSGRHVDVGHLVIGLDARFDPDLKKEAVYKVEAMGLSKEIALGGTGLELVTWLGDLGGAAAALAIKRISAPSTTAGTVFYGSSYGGSINLEGDVAGFVVANGGAAAIAAPVFAPGKRMSDALIDYLSPAGPSAAWNSRVASFLAMYGGTLDASGTLTNAPTLVATFQPKIEAFACNYLASRVKDRHINLKGATTAGTHITGSSQEVATAFVDALADAAKGGGKLEAKRFPPASPAGSQACPVQVGMGAMGGLLGL